MKIFSPLALAACITLLGCGDSRYPPAYRSDAESCLVKLKPIVDEIRSKNLHKYEKGNRRGSVEERFIAEETARYYSHSVFHYEKVLPAFLNWEKLSEEERKRLGEYQMCSRFITSDEGLRNHIDHSLRVNAKRLKEETEREYLNRMNREIDGAQEGVIEEYRRKAVSHSVSSSGSVRVDTFKMPNGSLVYCKTTVLDSGKAVSCK